MGRSVRAVSYTHLDVYKRQLAPYDFIRIHNSLLVDMNRIAYVDGDMVVLMDQTRLPISRSRHGEVVNHLKKHHM